MATSKKFSATQNTTRNYSQGNNMNEVSNVIINDVEFHWVKIAKPVTSFDGSYEQWEVQVQVPKKRAKELEVYGKIKEQPNGKVSINFRKKTEKADGSPAQKVRCVDGSKEALDPTSIGNGSKGNVLLMLKDYEIKNPKTGKVTKSGTSATLIAIQVTELIEYVPTGGNFTDFDEVPQKGKVPAKSKQVDEDDIPF
jgi:hypothetical protein